jgi:hypothetical protein
MKKFILPLVALSSLAPTSVAKMLCVVSISFVLIYGFRIRTITKYFEWKIAIFLLFIPGIYNSLLEIEDPEHLIRFIPVLLLTWLYPYDSFSSDIKLLRHVSFALICWLVVSQILIALGDPVFLHIRDYYYPVEHNSWDYGISDSLSLGFRAFRAAGLYYNPNTLASCIFLAYLPLYLSREHSINMEISPRLSSALFMASSFISILGIFLTGSRTYMAGIMILLTFPSILSLTRSIIFKRFNWSHFFLICASLYILPFFAESVIEGFGETGEASVSIKNANLLSYINTTDAVHFIFGGSYGIGFDSEYGCWFGGSGAMGLLALLLFYLMIAINSRTSRVIVFCLLLVGIGGTLFYGLLTATLVIPSIILMVRIPYVQQDQLLPKNNISLPLISDR